MAPEQLKFEPCREITFLQGFRPGPHKTSCTATDLIHQISVDGLYYVYGENKDADQLRNCCAADMYHYFVHMQKGRFSLDSAHLYLRYNYLKWHMLHNIE